MKLSKSQWTTVALCGLAVLGTGAFVVWTVYKLFEVFACALVFGLAPFCSGMFSG